jgi:hypothetical protein
MRDERGRFLAGYDPDRHELTRRERRRGYQTTMLGGRANQLTIHQVAFIWRMVRAYYRAKSRGARGKPATKR